MAFLGIIALLSTIILDKTAYAATEVAVPDIPSDYSDSVKWPLTHTESCIPAGKEYRSTAYARITEDKKMESVLTTSLNGTIFRYRHDKGNGGRISALILLKQKKDGFGLMSFWNMKRPGSFLENI